LGKKKVRDASELTSKDTIFSLLSKTRPLAQTIEWLKTGLPEFDVLLTRGKGLPFGKIIEIYGREASGKTALTQYLMGQIQKAGGWGVYVDFETSFDEDHIACYGIDKSRVLYSVPETLEDMFEGLYQFLETAPKKYEPFIIIVDSIASAVAASEKDDDAKVQVAPIPRVMSRNLRKLSVRLAGKRGVVIFINQIRDKINAMYGDKHTRPGGRALDFHAHTILETRVLQTLQVTKKSKKISEGFLIRATNKKNKKGIPKMTTDIVLSFDKGIDQVQTLFHTLVAAKTAITKQGKYYVFKGESFTKKKMLSKIEANTDMFYNLFMKGVDHAEEEESDES